MLRCEHWKRGNWKNEVEEAEARAEKPRQQVEDNDRNEEGVNTEKIPVQIQVDLLIVGYFVREVQLAKDSNFSSPQLIIVTEAV